MSESTAQGGPLSGVSKRFGLLLIVSLAFNLLVAGTLVGQRLQSSPAALPATNAASQGAAAQVAQRVAAPLVQELSEAKRAQIRSIFEANRGQNRALWLTVRERRAEVAKILEAESFDKSAYVAAMTKLIDAESKARTASQPTFAAVAEVLSPQERRDFIKTHRHLRQHLLTPKDSRRERPAE